MKEDLFDDIISTDVSEEVNKLFNGIYNIDDLKLYLETNNDIFKKTEIYDIKSDVKYFIFYPAENQILVTTGFFKLSENEKVDILEKHVLDEVECYNEEGKYVLEGDKYIGNLKDDVVPYSYNDICKKIREIIDNSTISMKYKYRVINYINGYSIPDINKIYALTICGRNVLYWFNLINDDILINVIMNMMYQIYKSLPKTTECKLRRAIAKVNKNNKN